MPKECSSTGWEKGTNCLGEDRQMMWKIGQTEQFTNRGWRETNSNEERWCISDHKHRGWKQASHVVHACDRIHLHISVRRYSAARRRWLKNTKGSDLLPLPRLQRASHTSIATDRAQYGRNGSLTGPLTGQWRLPVLPNDTKTVDHGIASRQRLRSPQRRHLDVPRHNRSTLGRRSFSVAGPTLWNSLRDELRDQGCTESTFKQSLKTYCFVQH